MIKPVYAIFDSVAEFYSPPFVAENDAHAIRMMAQSIDLKHKHDFALWHIAQYDSDKGHLVLLEKGEKMIRHGKLLPSIVEENEQ